MIFDHNSCVLHLHTRLNTRKHTHTHTLALTHTHTQTHTHIPTQEQKKATFRLSAMYHPWDRIIYDASIFARKTFWHFLTFFTVLLFPRWSEKSRFDGGFRGFTVGRGGGKKNHCGQVSPYRGHKMAEMFTNRAIENVFWLRLKKFLWLWGFFTQSVRFKLAQPQAAWLSTFYRKIMSVAPPWETQLSMHYWYDREEKKKAQHPFWIWTHDLSVMMCVLYRCATTAAQVVIKIATF